MEKNILFDMMEEMMPNQRKSQIAAAVVLFNPNTDVMENIKSYYKEVDKIYIIDNSTKKNRKIIEWLKKGKKIVYIDQGGNKGIASAFNTAAQHAIKDQMEWLLTMDQDSKATPNMFSRMIYFIENHDTDRVGIVTAYQETVNDKARNHTKEYEVLKWTISSGNMLNLNAYMECGEFLEELFIDGVDFEYSLRLHEKEYQIIRINKAVLKHRLGNEKKVNGEYLITHDCKRMFYRIRNAYYIKELYKRSSPKLSEEIFQMSLMSCKKELLQSNDRFFQLCYMIKGYLTYRYRMHKRKQK